MAKAIYLGHNRHSNQYYINSRGNPSMDKDVSYSGPGDDLHAAVRHLAAEYKGRKAVLKTNLPAERVSELQRLIESNKALKKMRME